MDFDLTKAKIWILYRLYYTAFLDANLKLDSQLKQQAEYQKPTTAGGGSDSGDTPDPKPDGGGEAPDPAA